MSGPMPLPLGARPSALEEYELADPYAAEFEAAMLQRLDEDMPLQQPRVRRYADTPFGTGMAEAFGAVGGTALQAGPNAGGVVGRVVGEALGGAAALVGARRTVEGPGTGAPTVDITAANVLHQGTEESRAERMLGAIRRMGRVAAAVPTEGGWTQAGLQRLIAEGQLTPPQSREDEIVDFVMPMLATMGIFAGAGLTTNLLARGAAAAVNTTLTGQTALTAAELLGPKIGTGLGARMAARIPGMAGLTTATAGRVTPAVLGEAMAGLGIDVGMGVGFAGAELGLLKEMGQPVTPEEAMGLVKSFAGFSLGLGALMRVRTGVRTIRAIPAVYRGDAFGIPAGTVLEGKEAVLNRVGGVRWRDPVTKQYTTRPSIDAVRAKEAEQFTLMEAAANGTEAGAEAKARLTQVDPAHPETLPQDLTVADLDQGQLLGAWYSATTLAHNTRGPEASWNWPRQSLVNERVGLQQIINDPTVQKPVRISAIALIRAIDYRLGEGSGTLSGTVPLELDIAAMPLARDLSKRFATDPLGTAQALTAGMRAFGGAERILGERVQQLLNFRLIETEYAAVRKMQMERNSQFSRGFQRGHMAMGADGSLVMLMRAPRFGVATVRNQTTGAITVQSVDALGLIPIINHRITLKDGRIVKVKSLDMATMTFTGQDVAKRGKKGAIGATSFQDIQALRAPQTQRLEARAALEEINEGSALEAARTEAGETVVPVPPTEAVTATGERVDVLGVSETTAEIRPKRGGKTRTVPREDVHPSTQGAKPDAPIIEIAPQDAAAGEHGGYVRPTGEMLDIPDMDHLAAAPHVVEGATFPQLMASGHVRWRTIEGELNIELPWEGQALTDAQRATLQKAFAAARKASPTGSVDVAIDPYSEMAPGLRTQKAFNDHLAVAEKFGREQPRLRVPVEPQAAPTPPEPVTGEPRIVTLRDEIFELTARIKQLKKGSVERLALQAEKAKLQQEFRQLERGAAMPKVGPSGAAQDLVTATASVDPWAAEFAPSEPITPAAALAQMAAGAAPEALGAPRLTAEPVPGMEPAAAPARRASNALRRLRALRAPVVRPPLVDFAPGTIPDAGHRILYLPVYRENVPALEAAWAAGESIAPFTEMGTHVVPPMIANPHYALYAVELDANLAARQAYTPKARRMLDALAGKAVAGPLAYTSHVQVGPKALGQGRLYRIADALHAAAQRTPDELNALPLAERTAYLRNLLTFNEHVDSRMAAAAAQVRTGQAQTIAALEAGDAVGVARGQEVETAGLVEAARQTQRPRAGEALDLIRGTTTPRLTPEQAATLLSPEELLLQQFANEGLTDATRPSWLAVIRNLAPRPEGYVGEAGERLSLMHSQADGQILFIAKVQSTALEGLNRQELALADVPDHLLTPGQRLAKRANETPFADLVPTTRERYQLIPMDTEGRVLREGVGYADSPEAVARYVEEEGYIAAPTLARREFGYLADDGSVGAIIRKSDGGYVARIDEVIDTDLVTGEVSPAGATRMMKGSPAEAETVVAQVGFRGRDASGGQLLILKDAREFPSVEAAERWFESLPDRRRLQRQSTVAGMGIPERFAQLPPLSALRDNPVALGHLHLRLQFLLNDAMRLHNAISPELRAYAVEVGELYAPIRQGPPYTRRLRDLLEIPSIEDTGPALAHVGLDHTDFGEAGSFATLARTGVYEAEDLQLLLAEGTQTIHLASESSNRALKAQGKLYGRLSAYQLPGTEVLEAAAHAQAKLNSQTEWTPTSVASVRIVGPASSNVDRVLGTLRETGEIVELVHAPIDAETVVIREADTGRESLVAKDLVAPSRVPAGPPEPVADGTYNRYFQVAPDAGAGALERQLGAAGVQDRTVLSRVFQTARQALLAEVKLAKNGRLAVTTPKTAVQGLFDQARRLAELEQLEIMVGTGKVPARLGERGRQSLTTAELPVGSRWAEARWWWRAQKGTLKPGARIPEGEYGMARTYEPFPPPARPLARAPWEIQDVTIPVRVREESRLFAAGEDLPPGEGIVPVDVALAAMKEGAPPAAWAATELKVPGLREWVGTRHAWVAQRHVGRSLLHEFWADVRTQNPALEKPLRRAFYSHVKAQLGGHPYAELQAKAMAGMLLPHQDALLRFWAKEAGLAPNTPLGRIVVEMAKQKHFNPRAAEIVMQMRQDVGYWHLGDVLKLQRGPFSGTHPDVSLFTFKVRRLHQYATDDMGMLHDPVPWKTLRRHPLTRMVDDIIGYGQDKERGLIAQGKAVWADLQAHDYTTDDMFVLREALGDHETWTQAAAAGLDPEYQYGFTMLRDWYNDRLEDVVRYFLRRRLVPIAYTGTEAQAQFLRSRGIDPSTMSPRGGVLALPSPDKWRGKNALVERGEEPSGLTENQINWILDARRYRRQTGEAPVLQAEAVHDLFRNVYTPERLDEIVSFWSSYGIKNYWPLIHEGNLAIVGGDGKVLGFAASVPDAVEGVRHLLDPQRPGGALLHVKDGKLSEAVHIEQNTPVYDDILVQHTSSSDIEKIGQELARHAMVSAEDLQGLLFLKKSPVEGGYVRPPGLVNALKRVELPAGVRRLDPLIINPEREFGIYTGRVARMEYRFQVMQAYRMLENRALDATLSAYHNVPSLHGQGGESLSHLLRYARSHISTALGEPGIVESQLDGIMALWKMGTQGVGLAARKMANERFGVGTPVPMTYVQLGNRSYWHRAYSSRMAASNMVKIQSRLRLGFSIGSAFANATQYWTTTAAKLQGMGLSFVDAEALALRSWKDGVRIWQAHQWGEGGLVGKLTAEQRRLAILMDESGMALMPMKFEAGQRGNFGEGTLAPSRMGKSGPEYQKELFWYRSMLLFSGAEQVNRYSTAVAALRLALDPKGMNLDDAAAKAFARNMVRETQFEYDELAIPHAITALGPIGRVLFQFKPFLVQMMSFEKDLMVNAFKRGPNGGLNTGAIAQLAHHFGSLAVFGGLTGLLANPVIEAVTLPMKWVGGPDLTPDRFAADARRRRRESRLALDGERIETTPDERFRESMPFNWENLFYNGVPGLVGLSMGRRVGVSGQDLALSGGFGGSTFWGPHVSMYVNAAGVAKQLYQQHGTGRALGGAIAGAALPGLIPGKVAQAAASTPGIRLLTGWVGGQLASGDLGGPKAPNSMTDILQHTKEGRRFVSQATPTLLRNIQRGARTWDVMPDALRSFVTTFGVTVDGTTRDLNGAPMYVPIDNQTQEAFWMLLGLPSIRQQETSAAVAMMGVADGGDVETMRSFVDRLAEAYVEVDEGTGSETEVFRILHDAQILGLVIDEASVKRRIETLTQSRLASARRRVPRAQR